MKSPLFIIAILFCQLTHAQSWTLWASNLPTGVYPKMTVAPNHDIIYTLLGTGTNLGYIYKANTQTTSGQFSALPIIPRPVTIQNNITTIGFNKLSEPLAGIFRSDNTEPWLFRLDQTTNAWDTVRSPSNPSLGASCIATSKEGVIYVGTRWSYIYKSTDDGHTLSVIDDTQEIADGYPCYYPSWNGSTLNGSIFSLQVDGNSRVYAGTETSGVIYSDDEGETWHPADFFACKPNDPTQKDSSSTMISLAMSGNVGALGFTKENQLVWSGVDMWRLGWKNRMGFADLDAHIATEIQGLPDYLIQTGQQVSRIVTTTNGQMFFHSGSSNGATAIGIYTSRDGIHWTLFNDGITGQNDGLSQGSLAVDGNKVFMATHDGKVWMYEDTNSVTAIPPVLKQEKEWSFYPNPVIDEIFISGERGMTENIHQLQILDITGRNIYTCRDFQNRISVSNLLPGFYFLKISSDQNKTTILPFYKI